MPIYVQYPTTQPNIDKNGVALLALKRVCEIVKVSPVITYAYLGKRWAVKGAGAAGKGRSLPDAIGTFIQDVSRVKQVSMDAIIDSFNTA